MWLWLRFVARMGELVTIQRSFMSELEKWSEAEVAHRLITTYRKKPNRGPFPCLYVCVELPQIAEDENHPEVRLTDQERIELPRIVVNQLEPLLQEYALRSDYECIKMNDYTSPRVSIGSYVRLLKISGSSKHYGGAPPHEIVEFSAIGSRIGRSFLDEVHSASIPAYDYESFQYSKAKLAGIARRICEKVRADPELDKKYISYAYHMACLSTAPIRFEEIYRCQY